ncbi:stress response protein NST1 [Parastagonospora nodorum]|nr:stress response protein NST1 [Parastagonospora nodorum]KAH4004260.1 stress response protein NST1 [Parastagonospora nodorum]KAH4268124.1 stress response protein NST1 [Parastagonospora nodorum]KAH4279030.1 stress response protein NST1 [Parastagonospora nodorum]KAH4734699.1 stress response protein NST1 [Parastagonospora nodorum]
MAQGTKAPAAAMPPNGSVLNMPALNAVNRKKQKRREKEAAKKAAQDPSPPATLRNGVSSGSTHLPANAAHTRQPAPHYDDPELDDPQYDDEDDADFYSDEEAEHYEHAYGTNGHYQQGYAHAPIPSSSKKPRKKKKGAAAHPPHAYTQHVAPRHSPAPNHSMVTSGSKSIWNTSTVEERERIREFWLSLGEDERKSLVKIEKEAVLRKMKEQQKHSCSCSVCGRKRTAIEEELEVLYDAYYEELEQYAHLQQDVGRFLPDANFGHVRSAPHPRPLMTTHPPPGPYDDEEEDEYSGEDDEEDYSNSEISSDGDYDSEDRSLPPPDAADFLRFGSSLTVKGGILTVADDLLKNDGKKFIEMMEQLAERRMQREEDANFHAHPSMHRYNSAHNHAPQPEEEEYDDEVDEEEGFEDEDYEEDDEDEDEAMTEEQRMEEGRRMFQIFAARMFEQRVLQAYREKVAAERQKRLLEELEEENEKKDQKEAKKAKEAQKRKEKKEKQRQIKAEEKAKKDAELAAKEAELKAAEEKRLEEQRKKREEQRKKKEAERKAQEEEKQRKEAERQKRLQEERDRQQELERKAREQKALEKKVKDDAKRKEREEREAKEKEAREKKAHDDSQRKEREVRAKAEKDRTRKDDLQAAVPNAVPGARKPSQPVAPALPPQLLKQTSSTGMPSPHVTPAVPKAPTPSRPRQTSRQGSHGSSPKTPQVAPGTSKSMSPTSQAQGNMMPKSILTKPANSQHAGHHPLGQPSSPMPPIGPPPGLSGPPGLSMGLPPGLNGFPGPGSMLPNMMSPRPGMPFFPQPPVPQAFRGFPPPGMAGPRGFPMDGPPGLGPMPGFAGPNQAPPFGMGPPTQHSRQGSGSFASMDVPISAPSVQPIHRPAPIQRPSSVKPHDSNKHGQDSDVDELADHLGSKALLDEEDVPEIPDRRSSVQQHGSMRSMPIGFGFPDAPNSHQSTAFNGFGSANTASIWGTPPSQAFSSAAGPWGNSPTSGFFTNPLTMSSPRVSDHRAPNEPRLVWLRRVICTVCKMLSSRHAGPDGFIDANEVQQQLDAFRDPREPVVTQEELKEACDIIDGTHNNGGGSLEYKNLGDGRLSHIKFVDTTGPPPALGEIGSPIPSHSLPVAGFGGRFPGLGPQGF